MSDKGTKSKIYSDLYLLRTLILGTVRHTQMPHALGTQTRKKQSIISHSNERYEQENIIAHNGDVIIHFLPYQIKVCGI